MIVANVEMMKRPMRFHSNTLIPAMLGLTIVGASIGGAAWAQSSKLAMLESLTKGEWTVRFRDNSPPRKICLRTGRELIQLQHGQSGCNRFVVEDAAAAVTVQYTCQGNGYGRTSVRRETATLVQLESQGIADGLPFQFSGEARRTGSCN